MLLEGGANRNLKDATGKTPGDLAKKQFPRIATMIAQFVPHEVLFEAVAKGDIQTLSAWMAKHPIGAKRQMNNIMDKNGRNFLGVAASTGNVSACLL